MIGVPGKDEQAGGQVLRRLASHTDISKPSVKAPLISVSSFPAQILCHEQVSEHPQIDSHLRISASGGDCTVILVPIERPSPDLVVELWDAVNLKRMISTRNATDRAALLFSGLSLSTTKLTKW